MRWIHTIVVWSVMSVLSLDSMTQIGTKGTNPISSASAALNRYETYSVRPNIEHVKPKPHQIQTPWGRLKKAHVSLIAQIYAFYPNHEIYFLARDAELLYDTAVVLSRHLPGFRQRIHLLNVSRANVRDPQLIRYLEQEGISEEKIKRKKILFLDTGFAGTIPAQITQLFSARVAANMQTQLIVSSNAHHPSSRAFLWWINSAVNEISPPTMHGTIVSYEYLPRFTDRSTEYRYLEGRWQPMSNVNTRSDGQVSHELALKYQEDLKYFLESQSAVEQLQNEVRTQQKLRDYMKLKGANRVKKLQMVLRSGNNPGFQESLVRDAIEISDRSHNVETSTLYAELGLIIPSDEETEDNKLILAQKYPQFKKILENPEEEIPKLIDQDNAATLGALFDLTHDWEITTIFAKKLGQRKTSLKMQKLLNSLIDKQYPTTLKILSTELFSQASARQLKEQIQLTIENGNSEVWQALAEHVFSKPHTSEMLDLLSKLIDTNDQQTLVTVANLKFGSYGSEKMRNLIWKIFERCDRSSKIALSLNLMRNPQIQQMPDVIRVILENWDDYATLLMKWSGDEDLPHIKDMTIFHEALKIFDVRRRREFLSKKLAPRASETVVSQRLKVGDTVSIGDLALTIKELRELADGVTIYKVTGSNGRLFSLVVEPPGRETAKQHRTRVFSEASALSQSDIKHALSYEVGANFELKSWVEGLNGEEFIKQALSDNADHAAIQKLVQLQGFLSGLSLDRTTVTMGGLVWNGNDWFVVDIKKPYSALSVADALKLLEQKFGNISLMHYCSQVF